MFRSKAANNFSCSSQKQHKHLCLGYRAAGSEQPHECHLHLSLGFEANAHSARHHRLSSHDFLP